MKLAKPPKPKHEPGQVPCPAIVTYSTKNPPGEPVTWLSVYHMYSKGSEVGKVKHAPLPMFFYGKTEKDVRIKATDWWKVEQAKEAHKKKLLTEHIERARQRSKQPRVRLKK